MQITIFRSLWSKDTPFYISIEKSVDRIRSGKSRKNIEKIRNSDSKDVRESVKKKLPAILFAGEFTERNMAGLVKHSGAMVIDFDDFEDEKVYDEYWGKITENEHVITAFRSPSGDGIKAVVKIPKCDARDHTRYFKKFEEEFDYKYFDKSTSDVSRVCYESYDPEIYYDPEAETYAPELDDIGYSVSEKVVYTPITDEEVIISKIMNWKWNYSFAPGQRNSFTYALSCAFSEYGVSEGGAANFFINHYSDRDFGEREIKNTVKSAYRSASFGIKKFQDYDKFKVFKEDLKQKPAKDFQDKYLIQEEEYLKIKEENTTEDFWYFEIKSNGDKKIKVDPFKYKIFLEQNGFKKTYINDSNSPTFVKIDSNIVQETSVEKIKDFVLEHLLERKEIAVWSYFAAYAALFSDNYMLFLETIDLMILEDRKDKSFLAFKNGIAEVTKNDVTMVDYIDVDGYIWKSHIIDRDFEVSKNMDNDYKTFIGNISHDSTESIESTIGYLVSTYKNKMNNRAVIFNDEVISDSPEGGTGKGLIIQGLKQIRKVSILDGKTFDDQKSFPYQTVSTDTEILVFDDAKKNWDFESKFSMVTEGLTLERKGKDAIKLSVEESPKIVVSTNYVIKGRGGSHDRRKHEIEVAQYYGVDHTPFKDFGRQLFDDWKADDFLAFDNYMIQCLQLYLWKGIIPQQDAKNIKIRKFIAETNREFYDWAKDDNLPVDVRIYRSDKYKEFTSDYPDYGRGRFQMSQKSFKIYMDKWGAFNEWDVIEGKDAVGRYTEYVGDNETDIRSTENLPF